MHYKIYSYNNWDRFFSDDINRYLNSLEDTSSEIKPKKEFSPFGLEFDLYGELKRCIVIEEESGKFHILQHDDKHHVTRLNKILDHPDFTTLLKCQYREGLYGDLPYKHKIYPYTYLEKNCKKSRNIQGKYLNQSQDTDFYNKSEYLYFKGNTLYGRDGILSNLSGVINGDYKNTTDTLDEFYDEMSNHRMALSLPGGGNNCHREIECFGIGVPVLMPRLKNRYFNSLIPNYHYISVDTDCEQDTPDVVAGKIKDIYHKYINDKELLANVSNNAREWYEENVLYPSNARLFTDIVGVI